MDKFSETDVQHPNSLDFKKFSNVNEFKNMFKLNEASVLECIDKYIEMKSKNDNDLKRRFSQLIKHLKILEDANGFSFQPIVIGDRFWTQFHKYLMSCGLAGSTINNMCGHLVTALKWAANFGANISTSLDEGCYTDYTEARPKISLSQDEISRITYFDIERLDIRPQLKNTLTKVRDQFVLSAYIGQRFSDIRRIDEHCFDDDKFTIIQKKTGNKAVVDFKKMITFPTVVRKILKKYNYEAPYPHDISMYNRYLHMLFKLAKFDDDIVFNYKQNGEMKTKTFKKWQLISSHTARRSMITNAIQRNMNNEEVRRASGHKSETAFSKYILWNNEN